jgi:hypothetical protein
MGTSAMEALSRSVTDIGVGSRWREGFTRKTNKHQKGFTNHYCMHRKAIAMTVDCLREWLESGSSDLME